MTNQPVFVKSKLCWLISVGLLVLGDAASAQQQVIVRTGVYPSGTMIKFQEVPTASPAASPDVEGAADDNRSGKPNPQGDAAAQKPKKTLEEQRLELLLATQFQRTPDAIFKAWSAQTSTPTAPQPQSAPPAVTGRIVSSYQDKLIIELAGPLTCQANDTLTIAEANTEAGKAPPQTRKLKILSLDKQTIIGQLLPQADSQDKPAGSPPAEAPAEAPPGAANTESPPSSEPPADQAPPSPPPPTAASQVAETPPPTDSAAPPAAAQQQTEDATPFAVATTVTLTRDTTPSAEEQEKQQLDKIKAEIETFKTNVTLGQWRAVGDYLKSLDVHDADQVYAHLLKSLGEAALERPITEIPGLSPRQQAMLAQQMQAEIQPPQNVVTPDDIYELSEIAPKPIRIKRAKTLMTSKVGADPVSGIWKMTVSAGEMRNTAELVLDLSWNGSTLTGSVGWRDENFTIENARFVEANGSISFQFVKPGEGAAIVTGIVAKGTMTGDITLSPIPGAQFPFTATLVEPRGNVATASLPEQSPSEAESRDDSAAAGQIQLPPGVSLDQIPPEVRAQLAAQQGSQPAAKKSLEPTSDHTQALANLIQLSIRQGNDFAGFADRLAQGTAHFGLADLEQQLATSYLMVRAGLVDEATRFLPPLENEANAADLRALKVWSEYALLAYNSKKKAIHLQQIWDANQRILAFDSATDSDKRTATETLIRHAHLVEKSLGASWILQSFTADLERGKRVLAWLGAQSADLALKAAQVADDQRLKQLELQNKVAETLIREVPDQAAAWNSILTLLADNWIAEAETSITYSQQTSRGGNMKIDMYGNFYWVDPSELYGDQFGGNQPQAIGVGAMLQIAPSPAWQALIHPERLLKLRQALAKLHMRVNEEDRAFPLIEAVAKERPKLGLELVSEFLRVWTQNHDPNSSRRRRNPYIYYYGFDQKADAIPLTRSKQERNLVELAEWVRRIRALNLGELDESLLARAFTTCHSSAEVFDIQRLRSVFGDLQQLKPETTASICETMRANLAGQWRSVRLQEENKTKRKEPEVQAAVLRGYATALELVNESLQAHPENWQLHLTAACLDYDQNIYSQTVQKSSEFSRRRDQAFAKFALAVEKYIAVAPTLDESKQSTDVFDRWFYAALGSTDLERITHETRPDLRQFAKIRQAIEKLPGALAEEHMAKFANNLFARMSPLKPEVKFRYLRGGFEIVGDHPRAWEAKSLYDYYRDLVNEIKLELSIDGPDTLSANQPFGVYVNIVHTSEIERESGGFGKYVQNQNAMMWAFNYGRPTENYRDKFSETVSQLLEEHFEILNLTFASPDSMASIPAAEPGWRTTPYAYLLLKPKGPQIDRIPTLKLDLDFLDTSGYVIIPIESAIIPVSTKPTPQLRPFRDLNVVQTLDERQSRDGKLILEVNASAAGLVPELEQIFDLERPGFEIVNNDDQGVLPTRLDVSSSSITIRSDRSWTVEYRASQREKVPANFTFASPKLEVASHKRQRYEDADLIEVGESIALTAGYGRRHWTSFVWPIALAVAIAGLGIVAYRQFRTPVAKSEARFKLPDEINPFTVLNLLQTIRDRGGVSAAEARELESVIARLQSDFFAPTSGPITPTEANGSGSSANVRPGHDLRSIADHWIHRAERNGQVHA